MAFIGSSTQNAIWLAVDFSRINEPIYRCFSHAVYTMVNKSWLSIMSGHSQCNPRHQQNPTFQDLGQNTPTASGSRGLSSRKNARPPQGSKTGIQEKDAMFFCVPPAPQMANMSQLVAKHEHVDISGVWFKEHKGFPFSLWYLEEKWDFQNQSFY